jgi:hypothetical protein
MLEATLKSFPRYPSMVFALAGDSTITKFFDMLYLDSKRSNISIFLKNQIFDCFDGSNAMYFRAASPSQISGNIL